MNGFLRLRCWRNGLPFRTRRHFGLRSTRAHLFAQVTLKNALISLVYASHMIPAVIFIKTTATCTLLSRIFKSRVFVHETLMKSKFILNMILFYALHISDYAIILWGNNFIVRIKVQTKKWNLINQNFESKYLHMANMGKRNL